MRWRVFASSRTPFWYYAKNTYFIDAESAECAMAAIESLSSDMEAVVPFDASPATAEMERAHKQLKAAQREWMERVRRGESPRGLL